MERIHEITVMESKDVINIVRNTLKLVDARLVDHGGRVAYILYKMLCDCDQYSEEQKVKICILGIFHDIGAYKTEEIDKLLQFETTDVLEHSLYGYLFLKYLSPLREMSEAVLYHHFSYESYETIDTPYQDIALMIHLADRIDVMLQRFEKNIDFEEIEKLGGTQFDPCHIKIFKKCNENDQILENLKSGAYEEEIQQFLAALHFPNGEVNLYLRMLVYSIDFRSVYTVTHTINTVCISMEIARILEYNIKDMADVYYGAMLHDVGKIAIPLEILENTGKLNNEDMAIMKTHVNITKEIIEGIIWDGICQIALRHHEKLDGSGYPNGLHGEEISEAQRIVAIADIISALSGKRSYKEAFSKEKIITILKEMSEGGQLCPEICNLVILHYDEIMKRKKEYGKSILPIYTNISKEYDELWIKFNTKSRK